jgi:hypothetical protein
MRLYLYVTQNSKPISFNYQSFLTGSIHKWLGVETDLLYTSENDPKYTTTWRPHVDKVVQVLFRNDSPFRSIL